MKENSTRARLKILLLLALPCFSVELKGTNAINIFEKLNTTITCHFNKARNYYTGMCIS